MLAPSSARHGRASATATCRIASPERDGRQQLGLHRTNRSSCCRSWRRSRSSSTFSVRRGRIEPPLQIARAQAPVRLQLDLREPPFDDIDLEHAVRPSRSGDRARGDVSREHVRQRELVAQRLHVRVVELMRFERLGNRIEYGVRENGVARIRTSRTGMRSRPGMPPRLDRPGGSAGVARYRDRAGRLERGDVGEQRSSGLAPSSLSSSGSSSVRCPGRPLANERPARLAGTRTERPARASAREGRRGAFAFVLPNPPIGPRYHITSSSPDSISRAFRSVPPERRSAIARAILRWPLAFRCSSSG